MSGCLLAFLGNSFVDKETSLRTGGLAGNSVIIKEIGPRTEGLAGIV